MSWTKLSFSPCLQCPDKIWRLRHHQYHYSLLCPTLSLTHLFFLFAKREQFKLEEEMKTKPHLYIHTTATNHNLSALPTILDFCVHLCVCVRVWVCAFVCVGGWLYSDTVNDSRQFPPPGNHEQRSTNCWTPEEKSLGFTVKGRLNMKRNIWDFVAKLLRIMDTEHKFVNDYWLSKQIITK